MANNPKLVITKTKSGGTMAKIMRIKAGSKKWEEIDPESEEGKKIQIALNQTLREEKFYV